MLLIIIAFLAVALAVVGVVRRRTGWVIVGGVMGLAVALLAAFTWPTSVVVTGG